MIKLKYILFFLIFGLIGSIQTGYACEKHCKKSKDSEQVQKQATAHHFINNGECEGEGDCDCDCNGTCGHSDCHCAPSISSILLSSTLQITIPQTILSTNFYWSYHTPHVGEVLIAIWQPPKIR